MNRLSIHHSKHALAIILFQIYNIMMKIHINVEMSYLVIWNISLQWFFFGTKIEILCIHFRKLEFINFNFWKTFSEGILGLTYSTSCNSMKRVHLSWSLFVFFRPYNSILSKTLNLILVEFENTTIIKMCDITFLPMHVLFPIFVFISRLILCLVHFLVFT